MFRDYCHGKKTIGTPSNYILEHIIAKNYHWTLEYIRQLDITDFLIHLSLCVESDNMEREFQMQLVGVNPTDSSKGPKKGNKKIINTKII